MANIDRNSSEERIGEMLGSLKRIEPPSDFDFRVKARIANGRPAVANGSWLPAALRVAMPLVLLLVGGYFAFDILNPPIDPQSIAVADEQDVTIADSFPQPTAVAELSPQTDAIEVKPEQIDNKMVVSTADVPEPAPIFERTLPKAKPKDVATGGSFDEAVRETRRILPRGFDANTRTISVNNTSPAAQISARQMLGAIGIDAGFASGWRVNSVLQNSAAARSGVKAGDVIEDINGRHLSEATTFESGFSGTSLRIRRGVEVINLTLR